MMGGLTVEVVYLNFGNGGISGFLSQSRWSSDAVRKPTLLLEGFGYKGEK